VKISAVDHNNAIIFWDRKGNTLPESMRVCRWVEEAGADALHVSTGSLFPHPLNPPGDFPIADVVRNYDTMLSSGRHTLRNYLLFRFPLTSPLMALLWKRTTGDVIEGINVDHAAEVKRNVTIPVLCTGGFQTASFIRRVLAEGSCDGVSIARPLMANPDLVNMFAAGRDLPERPCSYCNKCLVNVLENPLGCYDVRRYDGDYDAMARELMSFFEPDGFAQESTA
jgi:2,4-dienoyl-CoA reductase-like NADH-dependent reductase (Old Yellow Enzyme family)